MPGAAAMPDRIGEQFVHRHHEILETAVGQARRLGAGRHGMPQRGHPAAVETLGKQTFDVIDRRSGLIFPQGEFGTGMKSSAA